MSKTLIASTILIFGLGLNGCASNGTTTASGSGKSRGEASRTAVASQNGSAKGQDDGDDEVDIAFDQLPAAVRTTANTNLGGSTVKECSYEDENGQRTYTVELNNGHELEIAPDGRLIKDEMDDEDNDENDHEDHDGGSAHAAPKR